MPGQGQRDQFDLAVIGGGINGTGIAADAAGRGLSVLLAEKADLASGTSSASSKLIHGGLRYLEHYEFRLVREALSEREVLLAKAPHIIQPLRFVLPLTTRHRSALMLRAGLFLYDHLGSRRSLPRSQGLDLGHDPMGQALKTELMRGFAYWDCWVDDARLVVLNAMAAADRGAEINVQTRVTGVAREGASWRVMLQGERGVREIRARALVNAAGPWVMDRALRPLGREENGASHGDRHGRVRLVKGSHIVVPRIAGAEDAFIFQHGDGRVVFALPFAGRFTLIGTTDIAYAGDPAEVAASEAEVDYLLELANAYFRRPLRRGDVVWSYAGVRPLYDDASADPSAITRDYRLERDGEPGEAPLVTIYGGKITTYRRLAESALSLLGETFPGMGPAWTRNVPLPGGDMAGGFAEFLADLKRRRPGIAAETLTALARRHGVLSDRVLGDAHRQSDLGEVIVAGGASGDLTAREVDYFAAAEWAKAPDDVLWRRTKMGLLAKPGEGARISERLAARL